MTIELSFTDSLDWINRISGCAHDDCMLECCYDLLDLLDDLGITVSGE